MSSLKYHRSVLMKLVLAGNVIRLLFARPFKDMTNTTLPPLGQEWLASRGPTRVLRSHFPYRCTANNSCAVTSDINNKRSLQQRNNTTTSTNNNNNNNKLMCRQHSWLSPWTTSQNMNKKTKTKDRSTTKTTKTYAFRMTAYKNHHIIMVAAGRECDVHVAAGPV